MNFSSRYNPILYSVFLGLCFLFVYGYQFNTGDQAECLPQIYQLQDPGLYPTDFFMDRYHEAFTVRYFFVQFICFLTSLIPLPTLSFILTLLACSVDIYLFIKIGEHFTKNRFANYLAPIFAFFIFLKFTVGGNYIQDNSLIPGTLTVPFVLAGIWLHLKNRHIFSGLALGIGTLFQPLAALQVFMLLFALSLFQSKSQRSWKKLLGGIIAYLIPATFMLGPIFYRQFGLDTFYDKELYYDILYRFRNHLHYIPSLFPASDYIKFFSLISIGFVTLYMTKTENRKFFTNFIGLVVFGMLVYWALLEVLNINQIGKLQWFKTTLWASALACIPISALIAQYSKPLIDRFNWERLLLVGSAAGSVILLVATLNASSLPPKKLKGRYQVGNYQKTNLTLMHEWIADNLPPDAVVLCSPENTSFACEAKRNQAVQYQAIIHEPFYMLPWYERFSEVYGVTLENADRNDRRKQAAELYNTRNYKDDKYHIDYRIDNIKNCSFVNELGSPVHQQGDYILTKFIAD